MTAIVFVGGSRKITTMTSAVAARLQNIIDAGHQVVVGDANGADRLAQVFFFEQRYRDVRVFCSGECRNNVGQWPIVTIVPKAKRKDFQYFAAKDRALAVEATIGLMLWDGESAGTLMNATRLVAQAKPVVIYQRSTKAFITIRSQEDLAALLATIPSDLATKISAEAALEAGEPQADLFGAPPARKKPTRKRAGETTAAEPR